MLNHTFWPESLPVFYINQYQMNYPSSISEIMRYRDILIDFTSSSAFHLPYSLCNHIQEWPLDSILSCSVNVQYCSKWIQIRPKLLHKNAVIKAPTLSHGENWMTKVMCNHMREKYFKPFPEWVVHCILLIALYYINSYFLEVALDKSIC